MNDDAQGPSGAYGEGGLDGEIFLGHMVAGGGNILLGGFAECADEITFG